MKKILLVLSLFIPLFLFSLWVCSEYGFYAIEISWGTCGCRSGYILWKTWGMDYCISGTSYCYDKYWYDSVYDRVDNTCSCRKWYTMWKNSSGNDYCVSSKKSCSDDYGNWAYEKISGECWCLFWFFAKDSSWKTTCVAWSSYCSEKFGFNAKYSSWSEQCSCQTWYEFATDSSGKTQCLTCAQIYGSNSEYFYLNQSCWCSDGFIIKDGKCELMSNSAYFILQEYDTANDRALIQSEYDENKYVIELEFVLWVTSEMNSAVGKKIVLNMGTDFMIDKWDYVITGGKTVFRISSSEQVSDDFSFKNNAEQSIEEITQQSISKELVWYWQSTASAIAGKWIIQKRSNLDDYNVKSFVLRQEIIAIAVKIKWLQLPDDYICRKFYRDVTSIKPNNWVCRTAEIWADYWLVSKQNKDFNPESNVTRVEALAILFNAFDIQYKNFSTSWYTFTSDISEWQKPVLSYAQFVGINSETSNILANLPAVRGEIFTYIEKLLELDWWGYLNR